MTPSLDARDSVAAVYQAESRRVFATLVRLLGDFDLAEEALHEAFASALQQWPRDGVPVNPRAWLVSAGRFKAIDTMRRRARLPVHFLNHRGPAVGRPYFRGIRARLLRRNGRIRAKVYPAIAG